MTAPRPQRSSETADAPQRPAAALAESTSLVPAAPTSPPEPVRAAPLTADDARRAVAEHARLAAGATLEWIRAAVAMAAGGSLLALGTRALFERTIGPLPYDLPSRGWMLAAIAASSALGAALVTWTSATKRHAASNAASKPFRVVGNASFMWVLMGVGFMLHDAYNHAGEIDTSRGLDLPLAVVERRAELRPTHLPSQYALGVAYYRAGRYLDAERSMLYVRELTDGVRYPHDHRVRDGLGEAEVLPPADVYPRAAALAMLARGHLTTPDGALDLYRKAYEIGGPSAEASRSLYDALVAEGEYGEARIVAGTYAQLHPDDGAWVSLYRSAWDAARRAEIASMSRTSGTVNPETRRFEKIARRAPNDAYPEAYLAYAELKEVLGTQLQLSPAKFDGALTHARRAVALAPKNADYRAQLGLILTFGQHWRSADSAFSAAVALEQRVLERHDGFDGAWATARARMRGEAGPGIQRFMLEAPRRP